jgi:hypothetical protein
MYNRNTRRIPAATLVVAGLALAIASGAAQPAATSPQQRDPVPEHLAITEYTGPETCVACHQDEAEAMFGSVHYQQSGPTPNVPNIPGFAGERGFGDIGFNTYCGTHITSPRATCAGCHVGNGRYPQPTMTPEQLANIDCLMCHQDAYQRTPAGPFEPYTVLGSDGQPATIQIPIEDATGFAYMPDEANMSISILEAARTVHPPTRASCLRCHAGASGSDGGKRGDFSSATVNPTRHSDFHMSAAGADLVCTDCHAVGGHRVRGRGLDLRPNDSPERFTCAACHTDRPHGDYSAYNGTRRDTHALKVACQSCHIPTYAKDVSTEMERDWTLPFFSPAACSGQGGWKPEETRASDVVPTYAWFDGTSNVIVLGQPPVGEVSGRQSFAIPMGDVTDGPGAKLYPMKEHLSNSAQLVRVLGDADNDTDVDETDLPAVLACVSGPDVPADCAFVDVEPDADTDLVDVAQFQLCFAGADTPSACGTPGEMVPHSTFTFFTTADFSRAVRDGMRTVGMAGQWQLVDVHTYQTLNHGVEDHDTALACGQCHPGLSGGPARMDLDGALGYALKDSAGVVCTQCHGYEPSEGFLETHEEHVREEHYDCSWCHMFSRPTRGLHQP